MSDVWKAWKNQVAALKQNTYALYLASRDPRTPWRAKLVVLLVVAYALSPIDLIPDFVPVLGYVDDLLLLPLGIALAIKLIPPDILAECRARASAQSSAELSRSYTAAVVIALIWITASLILASLAWHWLNSRANC
jgi:uncharacterized membrane protein YkvA (DUF1232 family)